MLALIEIILLITAILSLAFFRVDSKIWTAVIGVLLIIFSVFNFLTWWVLTPVWIILIAAALTFNIPWLRMQLLTKSIIKKVGKNLPSMSETEKIALEAGDVWWEGELFRGNPNWNQLINLPKPQLTEEEKSFIDNQTEKLCDMLNDWEIVHERSDMPNKVWDFIKNEGFLGLVIGKEYDGHGFSAYAHSCVITKIASRSISAAINIMVPNSLGPGELLTHYGTLDQKKYYLPRLAKGKEIPCFGLTSPFAGSDATNMPDKGVICKGIHEGKEIIGIKLNFHKHYITLAPIATVLGVAFKCYDPDHLLSDKENRGITLCLISTNHPGVAVGTRHSPIDLAFMNGPIRGKNVFIPLDWLIGGPEKIGQGWHMLMECLSIGRGVSLPSLATATGKLSYRMTGAYAKVRQQFRMSIGRFEGVGEAMARIGGFTYLCESARRLTTTGLDQGIKPSLVSAISKYHMTEMARKVVNDAMDIHAGRGIQLGPKNYLGFVYTAIPVSITVEGANLLTRNLIIFGQGAIRCHPYILKEMQAINDLNIFDGLLHQHIGFTISNFVRVRLYGISGGKFIRSPKTGFTAKYYRQLTRMSAALALVADIAMMSLGGELKRKEQLSARLGDVLSHLYLASSVLKYFHDHDEPVSDKIFVTWTLDYCLHNIQIALDEFLANFPKSFLSWVLRWVIFPWGRAYHFPSDRVTQSIAAEMMQQTALRDRITSFCYVGKDRKDPTGLMELAFQSMLAAKDAKHKLYTAASAGRVPRHASLTEQLQAALKAGIINQSEADSIMTADTLCNDAVQVDEFSFNSLARKKTYARKTAKTKAT